MSHIYKFIYTSGKTLAQDNPSLRHLRVEFLDDPALTLGEIHWDGSSGTLGGTLGDTLGGTLGGTPGGTPALGINEDMVAKRPARLREQIKIPDNDPVGLLDAEILIAP